MGEITFLNPAQDKRLRQLIEINHRIIVHRLCATLDQRIFNQAGYHKEVVSKNVRVWIFWLFQQTLHDSSYASCQNFPCLEVYILIGISPLILSGCMGVFDPSLPLAFLQTKS